MIPAPRLTLYSKPGCHLCDVMQDVVERVKVDVPLTLEVVDISAEPALLQAYGREIPVLLVDGVVVAKGRLSATALLDLLKNRP